MLASRSGRPKAFASRHAKRDIPADEVDEVSKMALEEVLEYVQNPDELDEEEIQPPQLLVNAMKEPISHFAKLTDDSVLVNVYNLNEELTAANQALNFGGADIVSIGGAFHVGVEIFGTEWAYGTYGVTAVPPRSETAHVYQCSVIMGRPIDMDMEKFAAVLHDMTQIWRGAGYLIIGHNCCSFANALLQRLRLPELPSWVDRFARMLHTGQQVGLQTVRVGQQTVKVGQVYGNVMGQQTAKMTKIYGQETQKIGQETVKIGQDIIRMNVDAGKFLHRAGSRAVEEAPTQWGHAQRLLQIASSRVIDEAAPAIVSQAGVHWTNIAAKSSAGAQYAAAWGAQLGENVWQTTFMRSVEEESGSSDESEFTGRSTRRTSKSRRSRASTGRSRAFSSMSIAHTGRSSIGSLTCATRPQLGTPSHPATGRSVVMLTSQPQHPGMPKLAIAVKSPSGHIAVQHPNGYVAIQAAPGHVAFQQPSGHVAIQQAPAVPGQPAVRQNSSSRTLQVPSRASTALAAGLISQTPVGSNPGSMVLKAPTGGKGVFTVPRAQGTVVQDTRAPLGQGYPIPTEPIVSYPSSPLLMPGGARTMPSGPLHTVGPLPRSGVYLNTPQSIQR